MNVIASIAMGKIKLAIERIAGKYPLHAGILSRWKIESSSATETMGVGFAGEKLRLLYSPEFIEHVTLDQLGGVLLHETNHVLFDHVLHVPAKNEDGAARTTSEELCVNEWVGEPLPSGAIQLSDYPSLPENEDTDTRYKRLAEVNKKQSGGKQGKAVSGPATGKSQPTANGVPTVDDHNTWKEISGNAEQAKAAAATDIATAWGDLNDDQKADVPQSLTDAAEKAAQSIGVDMEQGEGQGTGRGNSAGSGTETLEGGTAHVPWQTILRRQVRRVIERRPVFGRLPRRFPHLVGIVPGKGRLPGKPVVLAIVDTSGSMSNECLSDISAELEVMARRVKIIVVECDTEIHAAYAYKGAIKQVHGRGGTDLRPAFDKDLIRKHRASLIVIFTDGDAGVPEKQPPVPVVWCLTPDGKKPTKWGTEIRMGDQETHIENQEIVTLYRNSTPRTRFYEAKIGTKHGKLSPKDGKMGRDHEIQRTDCSFS